mmetsp:Transcript_70499/g.187769  ORF Transcript_70499/g.187769 Transcript_70499/m.187769 type:complete len:254 (+) Transcript_70499:2549-3310(+)
MASKLHHVRHHLARISADGEVLQPLVLNEATMLLVRSDANTVTESIPQGVPQCAEWLHVTARAHQENHDVQPGQITLITRPVARRSVADLRCVVLFVVVVRGLIIVPLVVDHKHGRGIPRIRPGVPPPQLPPSRGLQLHGVIQKLRRSLLVWLQLGDQLAIHLLVGSVLLRRVHFWQAVVGNPRAGPRQHRSDPSHHTSDALLQPSPLPLLPQTLPIHVPHGVQVLPGRRPKHHPLRGLLLSEGDALGVDVPP